MDNRKRLEKLINGAQPPVGKWQKTALLSLTALCTGILLMCIFLFFYNKISYEKYSKLATEKIEEYITATYTDELDNFEKADWLSEYSDYTKFYSAIYSPVTAYGVYFYVPWLGNMGFDISYNVKTGEITDGYQQEYLTGKVTFEYLDSVYRNSTYGLNSEFYSKGCNDGVFSITDNIRITAHLERQYTPAWIGEFISIPETDYNASLEQLSAQRGTISLFIKSFACDYDDFIDFAAYFRDYIAGKDIAYNNIYISADPSSALIENYYVTLTREEMEAEDFHNILKEKAVTYTKKQAEADYQQKMESYRDTRKKLTFKETIQQLAEIF